MFRISMVLAVVALAVAASLTLVGERAAVVRTGYRIAELERERAALRQENRQLETEVAKRRAPLRILERAKELDVRAIPPEEQLKKQREKGKTER